jgi:hypothetical protein
MEYTPYNTDLFQGYYGSKLYDPEMENDYNTMVSYDLNGDCPVYDLDFKAYTEELNGHITDYLFEHGVNEEDDIIKSMAYKSMESPREYNFTTDTLITEIEVDMGKLKAWVETHKEAFSDYLKEHFTPRSGFFPFVTNDYEKYMDTSETYLERHYHVMVDFYLLTNIFGTDKFIDMDIDETDFMEDVLGQVNETFDEHMTESEEENE